MAITNQQGISGYAAVWYNPQKQGTQLPMWEGAVERVTPEALRYKNVRGVLNHDANQHLGRYIEGRSNNTLLLAVDEVGLSYHIKPSNTRAYQDTVEMIRNGDILGSSFRMSPKSERARWSWEGSLHVRYLVGADIEDVGPVFDPAYDAASVAVRSEHQKWIEEEKKKIDYIDRLQWLAKKIYGAK